MKLTTPIRSEPSSTLVYDKNDNIVFTGYHGQIIKNEIIRRVNIYDRIVGIFKQLKEIVDEKDKTGDLDNIKKLDDIMNLVNKTLKEI